MSLEFLAVRSSSSLVLLMSGVVCWRTYFLLEQPIVAASEAASIRVSEMRFIGYPSSNLQSSWDRCLRSYRLLLKHGSCQSRSRGDQYKSNEIYCLWIVTMALLLFSAQSRPEE